MALRLLVILALLLQSVHAGLLSACAASSCAPSQATTCCCETADETAPAQCCCTAQQREQAPPPAAPVSTPTERSLYVPNPPILLASWEAPAHAPRTPAPSRDPAALTTPARLALLCIRTT